MPAAGDIVAADHVTWPTPEQDANPDNQASAVAVTTSRALGATTCGTTFVAPASGRVQINFNCTFTIVSGTGTQVYMGPMVREGSSLGSGNIMFDAGGDPGLKFGGNVNGTYSGGGTCIVESLTPGATYNITLTYFTPSVSGSPTIQYFSRQVSAIPLP